MSLHPPLNDRAIIYAGRHARASGAKPSGSVLEVLQVRLGMHAIEKLTPQRLLALLLRLGPYRLRLSDLAAEEHTRDLGPLEPCLPRRLATRGKRMQLAPEMFASDLTRLAGKLAPTDASGDLVLIGRRQIRSNNSWMHRFGRLETHENRCTLLMHPADATAHGFPDHGMVEICSRAGKIVAQLEISASVMPGVVSLPHGFAEPSSNDITDEQRLDNLSGAAAFNGTPVAVVAVDRTRAERS
jgi:formylmethanofuran dehydrogenase subunit D